MHKDLSFISVGGNVEGNAWKHLILKHTKLDSPHHMTPLS